MEDTVRLKSTEKRSILEKFIEEAEGFRKALEPQFSLVENQIFLNRRLIQLKDRSKIRKLLLLFIRNPVLSKDQILEEVYNLKVDERMTPRFKYSLQQRLSKIVSRTRFLLRNSSINGDFTQYVEWLPFNDEKGGYSLWKLHIPLKNGPIIL